MCCIKFIILLLMAINHVDLKQSHELDNRLKTLNTQSYLHNTNSSFDLSDFNGNQDLNKLSNIKNRVISKRNIENNMNNNKPKTCAEMNRKKLEKQPVVNDLSRLKKCCPMGESLYHSNDNNYGTKSYCDTEKHPFHVDLVKAELYDNCIEDLEENVELDIEAGNPCNVSYIYSNLHGDQMFVLQDGSLLVMDQHGNDSYEIIKEYCLDVNHINGNLLSFVCSTAIDSHISRGQTILFAVFMVISIPCLISVSLIHFLIKELRTVHGLSLGVASLYLAIGYALHIYAQLNEDYKSKLGYFIQFFMLAYYAWFCILCFNICLIVWYFLPRYTSVSRLNRYGRLASYTVISILIPLCIVLYTYHKRIPGMPSFFYQAWSESIEQSQRYFIKPVSAFIGLGFIFIIISYFGFQELDKLVASQSKLHYQPIIRNEANEEPLTVTIDLDTKFLEEIKKDAQSTMSLGCIILITWVLEVLTFHFPGAGDHMAFMEIMNGLQGLFILMIFVVVRNRRAVIVKWCCGNKSTENQTPIMASEARLDMPPGSILEMTDMTAKRNGNPA